MKRTALTSNISVPQAACHGPFSEIFSDQLLALLARLQQQFEGRRQELLQARKDRQKEFDGGKLPQFLDRNSKAASGNWKVLPVPKELTCRRVEITGPVNSAKMVINMLNRNDQGARADTAMLDFEDSMKPVWGNVLDGYKNVIGAASGNLTFHQEGQSGKAAKTYQLNPQDMAYPMVRVRGLHLNESNFWVGKTPISAGLLDLATCFFHTSKIFVEQGKTPKYYIPKCEHYLEARWWNDLFCQLEKEMGLEEGTLRATFLIETLTGAFQMEEILYEFRQHAAGLNVGRWDKIFSDIKVLKNHSDRIMADRAEIDMHKPWMDNYAKRLIKICHSRGAFAIGGMSAFTPGKTAQLRQTQTDKVAADKQNEADIGHDGCWVSHPYFIAIAMGAFKHNNQLQRKLLDFDKYPDLIPQGGGPNTEKGVRTNVRVGIAYLQGWRQGIGCVSWDNLMEDLATLEISRAQTWQWIHHAVTLDDGTKVGRDYLKRLFGEELLKIKREVDESLHPQFAAAAEEAQELFLQEKLADFLALSSEALN